MMMIFVMIVMRKAILISYNYDENDDDDDDDNICNDRNEESNFDKLLPTPCSAL